MGELRAPLHVHVVSACAIGSCLTDYMERVYSEAFPDGSVWAHLDKCRTELRAGDELLLYDTSGTKPGCRVELIAKTVLGSACPTEAMPFVMPTDLGPDDAAKRAAWAERRASDAAEAVRAAEAALALARQTAEEAAKMATAARAAATAPHIPTAASSASPAVAPTHIDESVPPVVAETDVVARSPAAIAMPSTLHPRPEEKPPYDGGAALLAAAVAAPSGIPQKATNEDVSLQGQSPIHLTDLSMLMEVDEQLDDALEKGAIRLLHVDALLEMECIERRQDLEQLDKHRKKGVKVCPQGPEKRFGPTPQGYIAA